MNKMGVQITKLVFDQRLSIFKSKRSREIIITHPKEEVEEGLGMSSLYVELKLKEGQDSYYIRERSLGFRWFFTFLLFTQFRVSRSKGSRNLFFLFDEPASNLHQSAQQRLLTALEDLSLNTPVSVIYTTHSHHLINPKWLENTFIVRNRALDYDDDESFDSAMTDIAVEKYRTFVASYPHLRNYYQPVLDVLDYKPSNLEMVPNVVMVEGKGDFYVLSYFDNCMLDTADPLNLLPGTGAGSLDEAIRLYFAWGRNFIVLLDSDKSGEKQKERYLDVFGSVMRNRVFTLADYSSLWKKKAIEKLIEEKDRVVIQRSVFPKSRGFHKRTFHLAVQENMINKRKVDLGKQSLKTIMDLLSSLKESLNRADSVDSGGE